MIPPSFYVQKSVQKPKEPKKIFTFYNPCEQCALLHTNVKYDNAYLQTREYQTMMLRCMVNNDYSNVIFSSNFAYIIIDKT